MGLAVIKGTKGIVSRLATALDVHPSAVYRYLQENSDNLTKAAALKVIREETGLTDTQILEEETIKV